MRGGAADQYSPSFRSKAAFLSVNSRTRAESSLLTLSDMKRPPSKWRAVSEFWSCPADSVVQAEKLDPQPQVLVALGLVNTNPRPMISSLKSIVVPLR